MCRGTKPTLIFSMTAVPYGSPLSSLGVSPEGSTNRNGPLALSEAKREALSLRAGGSGVDSLIARGRDVDSGFRTPFSDPWVEVLSTGDEGYSQLVWALIAERCHLEEFSTSM